MKNLNEIKMYRSVQMKEENLGPGGVMRVYHAVGWPQTGEYKDKKLMCVGGIYQVRKNAAVVVERTCNGWYDILVPADDPSVVYARHARGHKEEFGTKDKLTLQRGHSAIGPWANGGGEIGKGTPFEERKVVFAGAARFDQGVLIQWNNESGHFLNGKDPGYSEDIALHQTRLALYDGKKRLLAADKFKQEEFGN